MSTNAKIEHCTSCGSKDIVVAGNKYLCRLCNIVYEVTDTGTRALDTNPLDDIDKRLEKAERAIANLEKGRIDKTEPPDPVEDQINNETARLNEMPSDEDIDRDIDENSGTEEDGFITWE